MRNLSQGTIHVQVKSGLLSCSGENNNGAAVAGTSTLREPEKYKIDAFRRNKGMEWYGLFPEISCCIQRRAVQYQRLKGEAYLKWKDAERPFRVKVDGKRVDVLGTSFNVMAYDDENHAYDPVGKARAKFPEEPHAGAGSAGKTGNDGNIS